MYMSVMTVTFLMEDIHSACICKIIKTMMEEFLPKNGGERREVGWKESSTAGKIFFKSLRQVQDYEYEVKYL